MNLIVAVDKNWAIGRNNKLLVSIPADMKFFRQTTTGKFSERASAEKPHQCCTHEKREL